MSEILMKILKITEEISDKLDSGNYDLDGLLDERERLIKQFLKQTVEIKKEDSEIFQKIQENNILVEEKIKKKIREISGSLNYNAKGIKALKNGYLKYFENSRFKFERKG